MVKYFNNYDEVEYVLQRTLNAEEREAVQVYISTGIRPSAKNCWVCKEAELLKLTWLIDEVERDIDAGRYQWPWPIEYVNPED